MSGRTRKRVPGGHGPRPRQAGPRRLVLTGGGTGGHLYPAISIAQALAGTGCRLKAGTRAAGDGCTVPASDPTLRPSPAARVPAFNLHPVFIGTRIGLEARVVPQEGFEFHAVSSRKIRRALSVDTILSLASIAWGAVQAAGLLRRLAPAAVVGTGGYASAGVVLAASMQGIPTLIHEQNSVPGRTNRLLARVVRRVAITFPESAAYFPQGKTIVTGLPVRPEIAAGDRGRAVREFGLDPERRTLLVLGGSLGARSLNRAIREALPLWSNSGLQILHQVGRGNWEEHRAALRDMPSWYHAVPYLEAMGDAYAAADVVCCRAGASTLAEVSLIGLPALLVPYPHAHADHQTQNARAFVAAGAALLLPDAELSGPRMAEQIDAVLGDADRRTTMTAASRSLGRPDAADAILDAVWKMIGELIGAAEQGAKRGAA